MQPIFKTYYARLNREAILKSLLWGLVFGIGAGFVVAFVTWFVEFKGLFLTIGLFIAVWAIACLALYFFKFKPSEKEVARRLDALGLQERVITMLELEQESSFMANIQREDAKDKLSGVGISALKFTVSLMLVLILSIGGAFMLGMTTVTALSDYDVIPTAGEMIDAAQRKSPNNYFDVRYNALIGGTIVGDSRQKIMKNESSETVVAVALDGYRFYCWSDGYQYPARVDKKITENLIVSAIFVAIDRDTINTKVPADEATDMPLENGNDRDPPPPMGGGGFMYEEYSNVIDGTIFYRDELENWDYYGAAMLELANDTEMSDELREFIEAYYRAIKN